MASFDPLPFASLSCGTGGGGLVIHQNNASVNRTGAGVYAVTIGTLGIDTGHCDMTCTFDNGAIAMCVHVTQTNDGSGNPTVKTVKFFTATTSAAADPSAGNIVFTFRKLPFISSTG